MRKQLFTLLLLLVAISCSKQRELMPAPIATSDAAKIAEAKSWFESAHSSDVANEAIGQKTNQQRKSLDWNKATFERNKSEERVYVPLAYLNKKPFAQERYRLLVTTDKQNKKKSYVLHYIADRKYYDKNKRISINDFTGLVIVSDWEDNFIYGLRYENAKIIGEISSFSNETANLKSKTGGTTTTANSGSDCSLVTVTYWSQACSGGFCDDPQIVGTHTYVYCTGAPSGSGGGGPDPGSGTSGGGGTGVPAGPLGGGNNSGCGDAVVCPDGSDNPRGEIELLPTRIAEDVPPSAGDHAKLMKMNYYGVWVGVIVEYTASTHTVDKITFFSQPQSSTGMQFVGLGNGIASYNSSLNIYSYSIFCQEVGSGTTSNPNGSIFLLSGFFNPTTKVYTIDFKKNP